MFINLWFNLIRNIIPNYAKITFVVQIKEFKPENKIYLCKIGKFNLF